MTGSRGVWEKYMELVGGLDGIEKKANSENKQTNQILAAEKKTSDICQRKKNCFWKGDNLDTSWKHADLYSLPFLRRREALTVCSQARFFCPCLAPSISISLCNNLGSKPEVKKRQNIHLRKKSTYFINIAIYTVKVGSLKGLNF